MVSRISSMWHLRGATLVLCGAFLITACVGSSSDQRLGGGLRNDGVNKVQVAVLLPISSEDARVRVLAVSAEQAARMAMEDLAGSVDMEIRVYTVCRALAVGCLALGLSFAGYSGRLVCYAEPYPH